jgi:HK97 family phage major capsid protein
MRLHEMIEKRANAVLALRALADLAETENRDLSGDEEKRYGDLKAEIAGLDKKIERQQELERFERAAPATITRKGDGKFEERAREFGVVKSIRSAMGRELGGDVDVGFEREISAEVVKRSGRAFSGIAVPDEVFQMERRTLLVGSSAADLVPNVHRPDLFIDVRRSALVTERLGATVLDGLVGTVDIPRQTGSSAAQWVGEDGSLTETDATFDDVNLTPKTVGAMTSYSRRTLINASPSIEQIVRNDLAAVASLAIDNKAMLGDASSNTPRGIVATSGVAEIDGSGGLTWQDVLSFISSIQGADAEFGSLGWALNAHVVAKLRGTTKVTSDAGAGFIMDAPNSLAGYAAAVTSALPGTPVSSPATPATMIFGAWSQLLIGRWSGIDLLVNPFESTAYAKGRVLVRAMQDLDIAVRHAASFAFADNVPVT